MQTTPFRKLKTIEVAGESYEIHPLSIDDLMADMQAWVDRQFPDPFDVVGRQIDAGRITFEADGTETREPYPMVIQQFLLRSALEVATRGRPAYGSPEADAKCQTAAGVTEMLYLSIRKGRPSFTREQARELYKELSVAEVTAAFQVANAGPATAGPKGTGPAGPAASPGPADEGEAG